MEDLKLRLKYDDINIRSRCLQKLSAAVKKKAKGNIINSSSVQVPELILILETCEDGSPVTSSLAVQVLISLVINKCIDTDYAINKLLGCMKAPSSYQSVINGICTLMIHEFDHVIKNKAAKYSLLFPKHPFIAALENKEDCFPFILESVSESLKNSHDCNNTTQIMEPFICYILCNPVEKQDCNYMKVLFLEAFIPKFKEYPNCIHFLFKCVPFIQIESVYKTAEMTHFVSKLSHGLAKMHDFSEDCFYFTDSLLIILFSIAERSITYGYNPSQTIELLVQLCPLVTKISEKSSMPLNVCLVLMSYMLKSASGATLDKLIMLGMKLIDLADISSTVASVLALSVIYLLPEPSITAFNGSVKPLLSKLLGKLESLYLKNDHPESPVEADDHENIEELNEECENETFNLLESFTSTVESAVTCVRFSKILDKSNSRVKLKWLESVKQYVISSDKEVFDMIYSLVASLFLTSQDDVEFLSSCLETLESILLKTSHLSTRIFSLLLYKINCVECPKSKVLILNFLPKSATSKYAIPPVLAILQTMAKETELKAHAIYLILQLWKKQDRCFPHLHTLLTESNKPFNFDSGVNEILIAQAAAILDICSTEPQKHGSQFVNTLASIYNKCTNEANTPAACLAIDGIIALCKSEIMEIRSTWKALSARLVKDKRTLISCRMYQLLALIPELKVKSFEYDKFMTETVSTLWKQIELGISSPDILCEAYKTLAKFPMDCHVLKQLPAAAKVNLKLPASMKATPFEMSKLPEDVLSYIPGYCFVDLLTSYEDKIVLDGYISFLCSLVKMEVEELPRSAYSQTRHVAKKKKVCESLNKVPEFLCTLFHSRKSPALQRNLAVGVLFCYEPPIETGKDGLPIKRSIATQARSYEQVLTVLLNEVNIDATEWHRCILISSAWGSFMDRAFFACEEARKAELELQRAHGHLDITPEELNYQYKSAWLWVRERFIGIIKTNVKNTSTSHANAIFATAGLVFATDKFYSSLDENSKTLADESDKYTLHRHFIAEYVETIVCAMHPEYQPTGKVQSWLLTHLSRPNSSATYLVTGCASASLCHLTPVLLSYYTDDIPSLFKVMLQDVGHSSPVLNFYSGKGLGLFIKSLCEAGYADGESQVKLLLHVVKEMMKLYEDSEGSLSSCLIGLTISITSMSKVADDNIKDWISTTCNIFYEKLMDEEKSSMQFEMLCICVTAMFIGATEGSCLPIQNVEDLASWIDMNRLELPQCSGISVSLGMLIEAFERFGHSEGAEIKQKVLKGWFNTVTSERKPTLQKIAALNGLCAMFSCGRGLLQVKSRPSTEYISSLNDLLPIMFQVLSATRDTGLQSICSWEVGRLFFVHSNQQQVEPSASTSYSYLGEKSILKPLMNVILSYQKEDEAITYKYCHILACLKTLAAPFPRPLPPINWFSVLANFLKQNEDSEGIETALKVAIYQCNSSSHATNLVSSYCNPPLIHTLPESCFKVLLDNIPGLVLALPPPKLQVYLQTIISHTVKKDNLLKTLGNFTIQGILNSLKQTGFKEQTKKVLHDAFISVLKYFKTKECYMQNYLPWISEGLLLLPDELQNSQLLVSQNTDEVTVLTMIWCYLIKTGKKPLSNLRACVEEGKCCSSEQKFKICFYIYDCFLNGINNKESEINQVSKCISWLLETIGWIQVLEDTKSKYQFLTTGEVYTFLVDICFATIIGCSGLENSYSFLLLQNMRRHYLLESLPQAINRLCQKNQWNAITDKIIDWFLLLLKSEYLKDEKYFIKLSLCSLRSTSIFEKKEIWTQVICNVISN